MVTAPPAPPGVLSLHALPADHHVHRATDAVLAGIDAIAAEAPTVLFLATTNFLAGVDEAFPSRADLVVTFDLPDRATIERILRHSLAEDDLLAAAAAVGGA